ncbi:MAG: hypothetical protein IPM98_09480 [Lewinellaceae bacterium]|nr:hypothetical protein [Lewinellaceae bacterium]
MEKNIHNDPLDDYVRNTFDDYEENPAADMWSRVAGNLPPNAAPRPRAFARYRLRIAAALILLLLFSGLVCTHFFYEKKWQNTAGNTAATQTNPAETTGRESVFSEKTPPEAAQHTSNTAFPAQETAPMKSAAATDRTAGPLRADAPGRTAASPARPEQNTPVSIASEPNQPGAPPLPPANPAPLPAEQTSLPAGRPDPTLPPGQTTTQPPATSNSAPALPRPVAGVALLESPLRALPHREAARPAMGVIARPPAAPTHRTPGWYIGLHATPQRTFEQASAPAHRPGLRPVFVGEPERPGVSADWWFRAGKSLTRRIGLESGIGYGEATRKAVHTARFRFADGITNPGGPLTRRNYTYDLSTYGGSAAVSLRMEPVDGSAPVPDDEPVVARISTTERVQVLRIPLLLTCRLGNGRVQAVAKTGLTGNFFLKNDIEVTARASQNNRLRFVQNAANSVALERTDNLFLGYWASAGVAYHWGRHLRFVAEPAVAGNFARRDAQGRRLPDHVSAGLNVGLNWVF